MSEYRTQNSMILEHLKSGRGITVLEALLKYNTMHLPRRILDLRQKGIIISADWIKVRKANGQIARVKEYKYVGEIE